MGFVDRLGPAPEPVVFVDEGEEGVRLDVRAVVERSSLTRVVQRLGECAIRQLVDGLLVATDFLTESSERIGIDRDQDDPIAPVDEFEPVAVLLPESFGEVDATVVSVDCHTRRSAVSPRESTVETWFTGKYSVNTIIRY